MVRSVWKGRLGREIGAKLWDRGQYILSQDVGKFVRVHNGNNFVEILVDDGMVGEPYGNYAITRRMGVGIHLKKRKKKVK